MTDQDIWKIWDEVVGVDVGIDPVPFAEAVLNAAPTGDIEHVAQVLACEIECSIFEQHVAPALEVALKALSPTQGADARPVAIYQVEQAPGRWTNVSRETFDAWAFGKQIVYATRDAAPSDAPIGYVNSMWAEHRVGTTKIYPEAHPRLATFPVFAASAPMEKT